MSGLAAMIVDGDGFSQHAQSADFAILAISRNEVERGLVGDVVGRLMRFTGTVELINHYESRMTVAVTGYDSDPRELYEIAECVAFFRAVNKQWSQWFHFAEKDGPTIGIVLRMLCDAKDREHNGAMVGMEFESSKQLGEVLLSLFVSMNSLYESHDFGEARIERMSGHVMEAVHRLLD